jgi:hypothetical protein
MLLGAALVVVPVVGFIFYAIVGRRQSPWIVSFNALMKSKSPLERTIANIAVTFMMTTLFFTFFAGLQLLGVPVPAPFRYSPWFWLPMVGSAVFTIAFGALFDAKGSSISEDWLDRIIQDDGTKESSEL